MVIVRDLKKIKTLKRPTRSTPTVVLVYPQWDE